MALLVFALTSTAALLLSRLAGRSVLSAAVLFLGVGFVAGGLLGGVDVAEDHQFVRRVAQVALVAVLFSDGLTLDLPGLLRQRAGFAALLIGLPLTIVFATLAGRLLLTDSWVLAALVGAILAPTDPVLASAIVGEGSAPGRLRKLLNVESGLNDGLALPVVIVLLEVAGPQPVHIARLIAEVVAGVAVGLAIPWAFFQLQRMPALGVSPGKEPLSIIVLAVLVYAVCGELEANRYLAAYFAGVAVNTFGPGLGRPELNASEVAADFMKGAAIFVFGAALDLDVLRDFDVAAIAFVVLLLVLIRPAAMAVSYPISKLTLREWAVAAWFGPKGFSSVVYALLLLSSEISGAERLAHVAAAAVAASIVLHSSTDVLALRWLNRTEERPASQP